MKINLRMKNCIKEGDSCFKFTNRQFYECSPIIISVFLSTSLEPSVRMKLPMSEKKDFERREDSSHMSAPSANKAVLGSGHN